MLEISQVESLEEVDVVVDFLLEESVDLCCLCSFPAISDLIQNFI